MKLATVNWNDVSRVAIVVGQEVIDLSPHASDPLHDLCQFLALGRDGQDLVKACLKRAPRLPLDHVQFLPPVPRGGNLIGVGMNYGTFVAAAQRAGITVPKERLWFLRTRGCLNGPYDDIWLPRNAEDLDYEAELAAIVGRPCRDVSPEEARLVVAGFAVANDLTLRERARISPTIGKAFDTHTPLGPWMVTPDELGDPHRLAIKSWVNGELRQDSNTADMITNCYELISEFSRACTLRPGDLLLTGTPAGCGALLRPPRMLKVGDVIRIEIEGLGAIENRVVEERS
jgi:2-keto-4-pentenoate hydratase/2-oxohepta-3-ene-1,7-dioic acid hydratase in catechol pathway